MKPKDADRELTRREESRLLKFAADGLKDDFPNPQRLACPEPAAVKEIALRRLAAADTEDLIDHIATCAPCFDQYNRYRRRHLSRRRAGLFVVCAAGLLATALAWRAGQAPRIVAKPPVSPAPAPSFYAATLDLRAATTERSAEVQRKSDVNVPHLIRGTLSLTIKLPMGTEDGTYAVQFRTLAGEPVVNSIGEASWDGAAEKLITTVDLRKLAPGQHVLALRKGAFSWRTYPVFLD